MENIFIFLASTVFYFFVADIFIDYGNTFNNDFRKSLKRLGTIVLLCLPVNIDGNVFTVVGNAVAEKSVYSVLSFYQKAENGEALSLFGFGNVQGAKEGAIVIFGVPSYQKSEKDSSAVVIGGIAFQVSKKLSVVFAGISGYQSSQNTVMCFGITGYQKAIKNAAVLFGLAGYQNAGEEAGVDEAIALYQKVQDRDRAFAFFSSLTAPAPEKIEKSIQSSKASEKK